MGRGQRDHGWFQGLIDHGHQLGGECVELDLVAEAGAERLNQLGSVVVASVEAAVDPLLDAMTSGLEQSRRGKGGASVCQPGSRSRVRCFSAD